MNLDYMLKTGRWLLTAILVISSIGASSYLEAAEPGVMRQQPVVRRPVARADTTLITPVVTPKRKAEPQVREDYFVSADTVIIGCTSGMAAGILVGSVPVAGAVMSGIGVPESITLLINLTGMGCGVGAVSSAVAIFTAWMLDSR